MGGALDVIGRLAAGEVVIVDGAWAASCRPKACNWTTVRERARQPGAVQRVHEEYIRAGAEAESSFRQLKDPRVVSFSPMHHWTEHNIRVHLFTCVLALQIAHLMRLNARRAGLDLSVRALLAELAGIGETILLYPGDRGRPKAHRMLTDTTDAQDKLSDIFGLARYAPRR